MPETKIIVLEFEEPVPQKLLNSVIHTLNNFHSKKYGPITGYTAFDDGFGRIVREDS